MSLFITLERSLTIIFFILFVQNNNNEEETEDEYQFESSDED